MCGIAGQYRPHEAPAEGIVERMTERMVHRGPDGSGFHRDGPVHLGMRRLAIVDLEHGDQPLFDESRAIATVFNGEIYNHAELRRGLEERGHRIASGSDGAILPHLYEELGDDFVEELNGIFAIALWDGERRRLLLARDRFGVKPLYWAAVAGGVSFSSEVRSLLADPAVGHELDLEAVDEYLTYRFVPSPRTLLRDVRKLVPGEVVVAQEAGIRQRITTTPPAATLRRDRGALVEEYREAFERAVVRQMMSDRPIGVMLSGGVDSAAITAVLAQHTTTVRTYTVGFEEGGDADETPLAEETARRFGTEHQSCRISTAEYLEQLPRSFEMLEEPVGASSALAVHYVTRMMGRSVPVALCGQGADEPNGGYWRHVGLKLASGLAPLAPVASRASRLGVARANARLARGLAAMQADGPLDRLMRAYRLFGPAQKQELYGDRLAPLLAAGEPVGPVQRLLADVADRDPLTQMTYIDTRFSLADELLLIADKMAMAASVELRVPFLDRDLVALVESMHPSQKVRGLSRKSLHKRAMLRWLPARVVYRKERGWATPMDDWLRTSLLPDLRSVLLAEDGLCRSLFDEQSMVRLIDEHVERTSDRTRQLFALFALGLWHDAIVRADGHPAASADSRRSAL